MTNQTPNRPVLVMLVGLPASGKSTARLQTGDDIYQYSTDDKIDAYADSVGSTYSEVFADHVSAATHEADAEVREAIANGQDVVWDQTNMSRKKRAKILKRFPEEYRKECICFLPPMNPAQEAELKRRLDSRPGKTIPDFVMRNMRNSFQLPSVNEGFRRVRYLDIMGQEVDRNDAADMFGDGGGAG